ncbi:MAG: proton-conducting transporter membrane subunit [Anaerolineaceae bacterium]
MYAPQVLLPILIPLTGAAMALLLRDRLRIQAYWTLSVMVASLVASAWLLWMTYIYQTALVFQPGGWAAPYGITFIADPLSALMVLMVQLVLVCGVIYALGSTEKSNSIPTFYPLFLALGTGLTGTMLTGDLFNLFVFTELMVISGAILAAISDDRFGIEAAYKYFYISLLASLFLLLAAGSLYVSYGTLNMADLSAHIATDPNRPLVMMAMVALIIFFLTKSAVAPFHFWQPDFHAVSPTAISAMLSSVVVKLGVYGFLRMSTLWFQPHADLLRTLLIGLGVIGVLFGSFAAVGADHTKRMLAYSTLGQIGYILVAVGWGTPLALLAALVYIFNHSLIKSALLMLAGAVASRAPVKTASFVMVAGVGSAMPFAGALFFVGGMALAGIPPTNGFISKLALFQSGVEIGEVATLILIAVGSLISIVYTGRAYQVIFWGPRSSPGELRPYGDRLIAPALLIGLCLLFGLWGEPLLAVARASVTWMLNPELYIQIVLGR